MVQGRKDLKSYIRKSISSGFLIKIIGLMLGFALQVVLARNFSKSDLGSYFFLISVSTFVIAFSTFGMNKAALKFVPIKANKNNNNLGYIVRYFSNRTFIASIILGLITILSIGILQSNEITKITGLVMFAFVSICAVSSVSEFYTGVIQGYKKLAISLTPTYVIKPILIITSVFVLGKMNAPKGVDTLLVINAISGVIAIALLWSIYKKIKVTSKINSFKDRNEKKQLYVLGMGFQGILLCNIFLTQTDSIMIGAILEPEDVAEYVIALKVANLLTFFLTLSNAAGAPVISNLYASGDLEQLKMIVRYICRIVVAITGLVTIVLLINSDLILSIFGEGYSQSKVILNILCIGTFINCITGPASYLLSLTGHQKEVLVILGVSAVLNVCLNYVLIGSVGLVGAAIATCITTIVWNASLFIIVRKKLGITSFI